MCKMLNLHESSGALASDMHVCEPVVVALDYPQNRAGLVFPTQPAEVALQVDDHRSLRSRSHGVVHETARLSGYVRYLYL